MCMCMMCMCMMCMMQARARERTEDERKEYVGAMRKLSICSEMMLRPGGGIIRSAQYHKNLQVWKAAIPAALLKVVITEELERDPDRVMTEVLEFLSLSPRLLPRGSAQHCVTGKAGIMDEAGLGSGLG